MAPSSATARQTRGEDRLMDFVTLVCCRWLLLPAPAPARCVLQLKIKIKIPKMDFRMPVYLKHIQYNTLYGAFEPICQCYYYRIFLPFAGPAFFHTRTGIHTHALSLSRIQYTTLDIFISSPPAPSSHPSFLPFFLPSILPPLLSSTVPSTHSSFLPSIPPPHPHSSIRSSIYPRSCPHPTRTHGSEMLK